MRASAAAAASCASCAGTSGLRLACAAPALSMGTALAAFAAVFGSVALRAALRPAPDHLFPLLSEVDALAPERTVLRFGAVLAAALLVATTAAVRAHAAARADTVAHRPHRPVNTTPTPQKPVSHLPPLLPLHLHPHPAPPPHLLQLHALSHQKTHPYMSPPPQSIRPAQTASPAMRADAAFASLLKRHRRSVLFTAMAALLFLSFHGPHAAVPTIFIRFAFDPHIQRSFARMAAFMWLAMLFFLMWYFVQIQEEVSNESPCPDALDLDFVREELTAVQRLLQSAANRLVSWMRPLCLSLQIASLVKILGLIVALETFRVSRIMLIRTALLAALAFAEYSAAFSFSAFLVILAIDMRRINADSLVRRTRLKLGGYHPQDAPLLV